MHAGSPSTADATLREASRVLVDAHVHFHGLFDVAAFLDAAAANFAAGARELGLASVPPGVLMLTESAGDRFFRDLRNEPQGVVARGWNVRRTAEDGSLLVSRNDAPPLVIIGGRQIVTSEGLEVLALGIDDDFPDGRSLEHGLDVVRSRGGVPVIPWGFGKWWLSRGKLVARAVESAEPGALFLGDNGGRLGGSGEPSLFELARGRGIAVLPGSDPLPLAGHAARVGSYGFLISRPTDLDRPTHDLLTGLRELRDQPAGFGRRERLGAFCRNQVAMQIHKRRRGRP